MNEFKRDFPVLASKIPLEDGPKWDEDYGNWLAGGDSVDYTLKEEHRPIIPLGPLTADIKLYVSVSYAPNDNTTTVFIFFDIVEVSSDEEITELCDDSSVYDGFLTEEEVSSAIHEMTNSFKLQLIGSILTNKRVS